MKKLAILSMLLLAATLIVLPSFSRGKFDVSKSVVADGYPLPPFPPNPSLMSTAGTLVADGYPLPPFPPNPSLMNTAGTLVADGYPLPPFPPNPSFASAMSNPSAAWKCLKQAAPLAR